MIICGKYILEELKYDIAKLLLENCDLKFQYLNYSICIRFGVDRVWILVNHKVYLVKPKPSTLTEVKNIIKSLVKSLGSYESNRSNKRN